MARVLRDLAALELHHYQDFPVVLEGLGCHHSRARLVDLGCHQHRDRPAGQSHLAGQQGQLIR